MLLRLKTCQLCYVQEGMIRQRQQFGRALDASVQHEGVRRHLERLAEGAREMGGAVASAGRERFERRFCHPSRQDRLAGQRAAGV